MTERRKTEPDRIDIRMHEPGLQMGWPLAGLTAELLAVLYADHRVDQRARRDAISFLANEMLENAVKFRTPGAGAVEITAQATETEFELVVSNPAPAASAEALAALTRDLAQSDPGELLIARIEANAEVNRDSGSGLGILTLMSDYGVKFDWRFGPPADRNKRNVTTRACLAFE